MNHSKYLAVLVILALSIFTAACDSSSSSDDAEDACDDLCSRIAECPDLEGFDEDGCNDICSEFGDDDVDISNDCDDALQDLFQCGEDASCEEIEEAFPEGIFEVIQLIFVLADNCEEEAEELFDACEEELEEEGPR